jgi:hypothetical protein
MLVAYICANWKVSASHDDSLQQLTQRQMHQIGAQNKDAASHPTQLLKPIQQSSMCKQYRVNNCFCVESKFGSDMMLALLAAIALPAQHQGQQFLAISQRGTPLPSITFENWLIFQFPRCPSVITATG